MADVVLEGLSKVYPGGVQVLNRIELQCADGQLTVLLGPSGCGKTTLLRITAGLEAPTKGTVRIGGQVVNDQPPWRRDVGMVFQRPALYPHWTVRQNLSFGLLARGEANAADVSRRAVEVARMLGLETLLERRPSQLSGGQQQRVALGRVVVRQPRVFLLDEPLSNLDMHLRGELRQELHLLQRSLGATMIYVTHDPLEAMALADQVAVLGQGTIQQAAEPKVVYDRPANRLVAAFFGWPPMRFIEGKLVAEGGGMSFEAAGTLLPVPRSRQNSLSGYVGKSVAVGLRPEAVRVAQTDAGSDGLAANVAMIESFGRSTLVTLRCSTSTIHAWVADGHSVAVGDQVKAVVDMNQANLFDAATGLALPFG